MLDASRDLSFERCRKGAREHKIRKLLRERPRDSRAVRFEKQEGISPLSPMSRIYNSRSFVNLHSPATAN